MMSHVRRGASIHQELWAPADGTFASRLADALSFYANL
jgi:hypothetical protein